MHIDCSLLRWHMKKLNDIKLNINCGVKERSEMISMSLDASSVLMLSHQ
jgi:hypothetical protein